MSDDTATPMPSVTPPPQRARRWRLGLVVAAVAIAAAVTGWMGGQSYEREQWGGAGPAAVDQCTRMVVRDLNGRYGPQPSPPTYRALVVVGRDQAGMTAAKVDGSVEYSDRKGAHWRQDVGCSLTGYSFGDRGWSGLTMVMGQRSAAG